MTSVWIWLVLTLVVTLILAYIAEVQPLRRK